MNMRIFVFLAIALCACASETPETESTDAAQVKEKRQSHEGTLTHHAVYRESKSHEQVAPVMEAQDDERLGNRTSLQPESEDQGEKVERPTREKPDDTSDSSKDENKIDQPIVVSEASNAQPQQQLQVDIQNNGLGDQQKYDIPPPRDGKSYTPEEFTSLIVSGYSITPVPDYGFSLGGRSPISFGGFPSTVRPPIPFTPGPFPAGLTPNPYFSRALPVSSTIAPGLLGLRDQPKIGQGQQPHNLEQHKEGQRSLPPPKNNKAYSVEEFNGLLAAGYPVTPVPVAPLSLDVSQSSRHEAEEYRPGQVFSLNPRELLELQPERKAPVASNQLLQQLYATNPQQEHKQNLQPYYFLEPQSQSGRQVPPSHAVIARPHFSFNGGEASVGAALSVSDNGANHENFDQELLALLGQAQIRPQEPRPTQATSSVSPQYQQVDRYVAKPSKKASKIRAKVHSAPPQQSLAPQQYLIETTNIQQSQQQQPQYRPTPQPQRLAQSLRYVPIPAQSQSQSVEQFHYERPESQGIKVVPAPKLQQQSRAQFNYRLAPQFQQQEASPKQYRILELSRAQPIRQELRLPTSGLEKPIAYLKRYPELEKQRSVKIYDPVGSDGNQQAQLFGEQFVLRPVYRSNDQRQRYELSPVKPEQPRASESTKAPHSAIYVSKNLPAPRQQKARQQIKIDQPSNLDYINIEQHGQSLDEQRSQLPPPKNNKAYTPEEFAALVAAGYSVTPVPVSSLNLDVAQSRSSLETVTAQPKRRLTQRRRNQYLPVRDDAP